MATSSTTPIFEIYTDKAGEFRWRARAKNGHLLAAASEGYKDKRDAVHCAKLFGYDPEAVPAAPKHVKVAQRKKAEPEKLTETPDIERSVLPEAAPAPKGKRGVKPKPVSESQPDTSAQPQQA